jgi:ADP-ribose pyrophosphatase
MSQEVVAIDIDSDELVGKQPGGFLVIRRLRVRNRRADGTHSRPYTVDFLDRPAGLDAVVVVAWHRTPAGQVQVLVREGLRPPLHFGRAPDKVAVPEPPHGLWHRELVAGIIEPGDHPGLAGVQARAVAELHEEAGLTAAPGDIQLLGPSVFPSVGVLPERFFFVHVEIRDPSAGHAPEGDGSPYEEGARLLWLPLDEALAMCGRGELEDLKTELGLRRLAEILLKT